MDAPFSGRIVGDRLHGRGAYDMKGSLAAIMTVAAAYARSPGPGDLWLAIVADEEHGSSGSEAVLRQIARRGARIDGAVITEPSDLQLMPGHRGFATGTLITRGRAAHTARRDQGVDAIAMMARVISACEDLDLVLNSGAPHPLLGHGALVVSLLQGGSELFTYPVECRAQFVRRMLPGQTQAQLDQELRAQLAELARRDARFNVELSWQLWRKPLLTPLDAPLTRALSDCAQAELGRAPDIAGAPWWTDGALFQEAGIPAVIFGPRGGGIHAIDEWVALSSLESLARILDRLCRVSPP
jgi:acetylornithine deacetylase